MLKINFIVRGHRGDRKETAAVEQLDGGTEVWGWYGRSWTMTREQRESGHIKQWEYVTQDTPFDEPDDHTATAYFPMGDLADPDLSWVSQEEMRARQEELARRESRYSVYGQWAELLRLLEPLEWPVFSQLLKELKRGFDLTRCDAVRGASLVPLLYTVESEDWSPCMPATALLSMLAQEGGCQLTEWAPFMAWIALSGAPLRDGRYLTILRPSYRSVLGDSWDSAVMTCIQGGVPDKIALLGNLNSTLYHKPHWVEGGFYAVTVPC